MDRSWLLVFVAAALGCGGAKSSTQSASEAAALSPAPATSAAAGQGATQAADGDLLVVGNKDEATAMIFEVSSGRRLATVDTGPGPHEIAVSSDGATAIVSNYGRAGEPGGTLTVIDLVRLRVATTIDVAPHERPHGLAFTSDDKTLLVTSETSEAVIEVNLATGQVVAVRKTNRRGSHMLVRSADDRLVITADIGSGTATVLDRTGASDPRTVEVAPGSEAIALSPDGKWLWVGSNDVNQVFVFDTASWDKLAALRTETLPIRVELTPDGSRALVSCAASGQLRIFDAQAFRELSVIAFAKGRDPAVESGSAVPIGIAVAPDGQRAYVSLSRRDEVAIVDLATARVVGALETGKRPDGIAYVARR